MVINFDIHLLAQIVVYVGIFITGFAISIPLGVTTIHFKGGCVLFAPVTWENASHFSVNYQSLGNCNFPIYSSVFLCIFYAVIMTSYYGYAFLRKDRNIGFQMWVMPFILINAAITLVMLIDGFIISIGFKIFCDGLTSSPYTNNTFIHKCIDAQNSNATKWLEGINGSDFFSLLSVSQLAAWISFLLWAVQLFLSILRFIRIRRLRSWATLQDAPKQQDQTNSAAVTPNY